MIISWFHWYFRTNDKGLIFTKKKKKKTQGKNSTSTVCEHSTPTVCEQSNTVYFIYHFFLVTHRDHFVRCLSVCPSVTLQELCFAGDTCIRRNAASILVTWYGYGDVRRRPDDVSHSSVPLGVGVNLFMWTLFTWHILPFLARLHFSAEELLLYPRRRRQRPCRRWRRRQRQRPHAKC